MARIYIEDMAADQIKAIAQAFSREEDFDINGKSIGFNLDGLVATDTPISEWISARGEPTREGDLYVFDGRSTVRNPTKQGRSKTVGEVVCVLEIPGGTVSE